MSAIAKAFVAAKKEFAPALKTSTNPHFRSKYADLAGCLEAVNDALLNHGIAIIQETSESDSGVVVETVFIHESGETIRGGKLHVPASKQDPQGYGSALTYARRYSIMAACGIAAEDDDGNAASRTKSRNSLDGMGATSATFNVHLPGKDEPHSTHTEPAACVDAIVKMVAQVERNNKADAKEKIAKISALKEANLETINRLEVVLQAKAKASFTTALQRLEATNG
jgi:hypothetical protein